MATRKQIENALAIAINDEAVEDDNINSADLENITDRFSDLMGTLIEETQKNEPDEDEDEDEDDKDESSGE